MQLFGPVPLETSHGPQDNRPGKPVREGTNNARRARETRQAPYVDTYALQAPDPYGSFYQRQALPPVDPLPVRDGLMSDFDYHGVDLELEHLHHQRVREHTMDVEIQRRRF